MLRIVCPDGVNLNFLDESNIEYTVEDGELTVKNKKTKEIFIQLKEGKWSHVITDLEKTTITA